MKRKILSAILFLSAIALVMKGIADIPFPAGNVHVPSPCVPPNRNWEDCFNVPPDPSAIILDLPYVDGFRGRTDWEEIEGTEGVRNWAGIDAAIATIASHGKFIGLSFASGNTGTPDWLYGGAPPTNECSTTVPSPCCRMKVDPVDLPNGWLPIIWDPCYMNKYHAFITAFGAKYNNNPTVKYIVITGFMQNTELYLSQTALDDAKWSVQATLFGYADRGEAYQFAGKTFIDWFAQAFPNKKIILSEATKAPWSTTPLSAVDRAAVLDYGRTTYPNQFGEQNNGAHAKLPVNQPTPPYFKAPYSFGSQQVSGSGGTNPLHNFYAPPIECSPAPPSPTPAACIPPEPMVNYMNQQVKEGRQYAEIYADDLTDPVNAPILTSHRLLLIANVPGSAAAWWRTTHAQNGSQNAFDPPMIFAKPISFERAMQTIEIRSLLPTTLKSAELEQISRDILDRAFFSARVHDAEILQQISDVLDQYRRGELGLAEARLALKQFLADVSYIPAGPGIANLTSTARLDLIIETNSAMAAGYGDWLYNQQPAILDQWPAQELFRAAQSKTHRNWRGDDGDLPMEPEEGRWLEAGGQLLDGKMIALRNDSIWTDISRFGTPYPPFDFNSHMRTRLVPRRTAIELGLIDRDAQISPPARRFNETLQSSAEVRSASLQAALRAAGYHFTKDGTLTP